MDFYEGTLEGKKVVVVRSGIGKVNAGMCTQILADVVGVEAVINTGIAGSLNNDVNIGDIVLSTDVLHHDMDAIGFGYKKGQIPQMDEFSFPADEKLRKLAAKVCKEVNPAIRVFEGRICSGDQFISDKSVKDAIISEFGGFAVEMEGAAIGQAAYLNHMYNAARYVCTQPDMQVVQLVSFGCGTDAITTDELRDILEKGGKLYTQLKIDDISNLGAVKIRIRSLMAAMEARQAQDARG